MKLIQLRYLVAVAENDLNITQAARAMHAAQPGGFMYDFLQMLAPHLTTRLVQSAESSTTQDDVDREFSAVKIPFLR